MTELPGCPVCATAIDDAADCSGCGWRLRSPVLLGEITDEVCEEFAAQLTAARRDLDLGAVRRVVDELGAADPSIGARLTQLVRGTPPAPTTAARVAPAAQAAWTELAAIVGPALSRLVDAGIDGLTVVELTADGVTARTIEADRAGSPRASEPTAWRWAALVQGLPVDRDPAVFRLAGGIGSADPRPTPLVVRLEPALAGVPAGTGRHPVLVVRRVAGWPVIDRAARELADRLAADRSTVDNEVPAAAPPRDTLEAVLRSAPLRHDYALALAELDPPTRRVRLVARPLFAAGTVVNGSEVVAEVPVAAPAAWSGGELQLAVVARPEGTPGQWIPVTGGRLPVPAGGRATVRVALAGPGEVRFPAPPGARLAELDWPALVAQLPDVYGADQVDVVCAIELAEREPGHVRTRLRLVQELLDMVDAEHPDPNAVRIGLLGYDDHIYDDVRVWKRSVVRRVLPAPTAELRAALLDWQPSARRHAYAAPIEDAIDELTGWPWRPGAAAALITLGALPPHPKVPVDRTKRCTVEHDWRVTLDRVVAERDLRRIALRDTPEVDLNKAGAGAARRAAEAWRVLGADGLAARERASARWLADAAGIFPAATPRALQLPIAAGGAA